MEFYDAQLVQTHPIYPVILSQLLRFIRPAGADAASSSSTSWNSNLTTNTNAAKSKKIGILSLGASSQFPLQYLQLYGHLDVNVTCIDTAPMLEVINKRITYGCPRIVHSIRYSAITNDTPTWSTISNVFKAENYDVIISNHCAFSSISAELFNRPLDRQSFYSYCETNFNALHAGGQFLFMHSLSSSKTTVFDILIVLSECGFVESDCVWRQNEYAVITARKPHIGTVDESHEPIDKSLPIVHSASYADSWNHPRDHVDSSDTVMKPITFENYHEILAETEAKLVIERYKKTQLNAENKQGSPNHSSSSNAVAVAQPLVPSRYRHADGSLTTVGKSLVNQIFTLCDVEGHGVLNYTDLLNMLERVGRFRRSKAQSADAHLSHSLGLEIDEKLPKSNACAPSVPTVDDDEDDDSELWWLYQSLCTAHDGMNGLGEEELCELYSSDWPLEEDARKLGLTE